MYCKLFVSGSSSCLYGTAVAECRFETENGINFTFSQKDTGKLEVELGFDSSMHSGSKIEMVVMNLAPKIGSL